MALSTAPPGSGPAVLQDAAKKVLRKRLCQAVLALQEAFQDTGNDQTGSLCQVWLPERGQDGVQVLQTKGLPFCVAGVGDLLALFRCISCRHYFGTDVRAPFVLGTPGRVFTSAEPEMSRNVQKIDRDVYTRATEAAHCHVHATLMLPLFMDASRCTVVGVLEVVQTVQDMPVTLVRTLSSVLQRCQLYTRESVSEKRQRELAMAACKSLGTLQLDPCDDPAPGPAAAASTTVHQDSPRVSDVSTSERSQSPSDAAAAAAAAASVMQELEQEAASAAENAVQRTFTLPTPLLTGRCSDLLTDGSPDSKPLPSAPLPVPPQPGAVQKSEPLHQQGQTQQPVQPRQPQEEQQQSQQQHMQLNQQHSQDLQQWQVQGQLVNQQQQQHRQEQQEGRWRSEQGVAPATPALSAAGASARVSVQTLHVNLPLPASSAAAATPQVASLLLSVEDEMRDEDGEELDLYCSGSDGDEEMTVVDAGEGSGRRRRARRGPGHPGKPGVHLKLEQLQQLFGVPLLEAAEHLGVCHTTLKRACRRLGIKRWPRRRLLALRKAVDHAAATTDTAIPPPPSKAPAQASATKKEDPDEPADKRWLTLSHLEPAIRAAVAQQEAITAPPAGSGDQRKHAALPPARPAAPDVQPGSSFGSEAQLHPLKSLSAGPQVEPRAGSQPNRPCMLQQNVHPGSRPTWPSLQERHSPQERTGLLVAHVGLDSHAATFRNPPAATATAVGPMAAQGLAQGLAPPQWLPAPPPPPQQSAFPPFTDMQGATEQVPQLPVYGYSDPGLAAPVAPMHPAASSSTAAWAPYEPRHRHLAASDARRSASPGTLAFEEQRRALQQLAYQPQGWAVEQQWLGSEAPHPPPHGQHTVQQGPQELLQGEHDLLQRQHTQPHIHHDFLQGQHAMPQQQQDLSLGSYALCQEPYFPQQQQQQQQQQHVGKVPAPPQFLSTPDSLASGWRHLQDSLPQKGPAPLNFVGFAQEIQAQAGPSISQKRAPSPHMPWAESVPHALHPAPQLTGQPSSAGTPGWVSQQHQHVRELQHQQLHQPQHQHNEQQTLSAEPAGREQQPVRGAPPGFEQQLRQGGHLPLPRAPPPGFEGQWSQELRSVLPPAGPGPTLGGQQQQHQLGVLDERLQQQQLQQRALDFLHRPQVPSHQGPWPMAGPQPQSRHLQQTQGLFPHQSNGLPSQHLHLQHHQQHLLPNMLVRPPLQATSHQQHPQQQPIGHLRPQKQSAPGDAGQLQQQTGPVGPHRMSIGGQQQYHGSSQSTHPPRAPVADPVTVNEGLLQLVRDLQPLPHDRTQQSVAFDVIQGLLKGRWPEAEVHLFGSTATRLSLRNCNDLDISLVLDCDPVEKGAIIKEVASLMEELELDDVKAITTARIPLVKCTFRTDDMSIGVDVTLNNRLAITNTRLLSDYGSIDGRLAQLVFVVKHWAKRRQTNDAYRGTLSSYCYVLMCIFHLQQRHPPILPPLQRMEPTFIQNIDNWDCSYFNDIESIRDFGTRNTETLGELCASFFRFWAWEFNYGRDAVSIRLGTTISKASKDWNRRIGTERHLLGVEDPFVQSHDLGRTVDKFTMKFLRAEFERAATILQGERDPLPLLFQPREDRSSSRP